MVAQVAGKKPLGAMGRAGIVIGMHAAVLFVIAQGFVMKAKEKENGPLVTTVIDDPIPIDQPPPVAPPELVRPDLYVPAPDFPAEIPSNDGVIAEVLPDRPVVIEPQAGAGPDIPTTVVRMLPNGITQPPYPSSMTRENREGVTVLEVYVLPNGRVGDVRVLKSAGAGAEAFDLSAMNEAKRNWRFTPATRNGEPVAQWYPLRVVFKLTKGR